MIYVYRLLFIPALLIASPYYLWRMRRRGGYAEGFWHRFGEVPPLPAKPDGVKRVWLQAVSVGEILAIAPLLEAFKREGRTEVYLTTTTSTGSAGPTRQRSHASNERLSGPGNSKPFSSGSSTPAATAST